MYSTTQLAGGDSRSRDTVWVFGGSLTKKIESSTVQVTVARDIIPSGFGLLIQTDRVATTVSHNLTETLTATFDASGYRVTGVTFRALGGSFSEQKYLYVTPSIAWKFLEWWKRELSYTYRWQGTEGIPDATSNATIFTVTYYPPKLASSN